MKTILIALVPLSLGLTACGGDSVPEEAPTVAAAAPAGHGSSIDLGTLTVAGRQFGILRLGDLEPGQEGAFQVRAIGSTTAELANLNTYLWVENEDGKQLSAPAKGSPEGDALHFHLIPRKGEKRPSRVVLRLRVDGTDERANLPLDGHGHEHRDGPHDGVLATFKIGDVNGHLELKLHDDEGDLELWLFEDAQFARPFDLSLTATIGIEFVDVGRRQITLRPRNQTDNQDEDGNANIRDGKTNYFIFPSRDGEDATWLRGEQFQSIVVLQFTLGGQSYLSEEFVLKPHVH